MKITISEKYDEKDINAAQLCLNSLCYLALIM